MENITSIRQRVATIYDQIEAAQAHTQEDLEAFKHQFIGKKGVITELLEQLKTCPAAQRKEMGILLNTLKESAQQKFKALIQQINTSPVAVDATDRDLTLPPPSGMLGGAHPISIVLTRIIEIFERIGFNVSEGPEIEDDWHNFTALNFPADHPARAMQDTFFVTEDHNMVLRTHTSSVQVRVMENKKPPIRTISPGVVYRNEAISARAHCIFHQVEGLYVNQGVSFADLKETLLYFAREMFGPTTQLRLRPSYFPFTEPSAELDVSCMLCNGQGCKVCKNSGWLEIGGAGMVDPNVLTNVHIDSEVYTGFAFGMGIERMAMLLYQVNDLRLFTENDVRFLKQFVAES